MSKAKTFQVTVFHDNGAATCLLVSATTRAQAARCATVHIENTMPTLNIHGVQAELVK